MTPRLAKSAAVPPPDVRVQRAPVATLRTHQPRGVAVTPARISFAFRPRGIRLYMAGPAAFAVVLGHRWNALPPTRLHEFLRAGSRYVETATI